jgi:hypothetical protein
MGKTKNNKQNTLPDKKSMIVVLAFLCCGFITACTKAPEADEKSPFDMPPIDTSFNFDTQVKPIMDKRCVVCHACYDAPCQLKLGSYEGVARGANKKPVYKGDRLIAANLTRLFIDAHSASEWREKEFHPVMNEDNRKKEGERGSLLMAMLAQKQAHPMQANAKLDKSFKLDINRDLQCPTYEEHAGYQKDYPLWGMPYGLPALNETEHNTIKRWLDLGSPAAPQQIISEADSQGIEKWETFLNSNDMKSQLMARYLYEHFFIAHFYFSQSETARPRFFRLFRSYSPPGEPIDIIATRRPFSDPKVKRVYYRFEPVRQTIVDKVHMPFALNDNRLKKYSQWFIEADYEVTTLPSYEPEKAANPFTTFSAIPVKSRYQFLLDEAQYTIMQFIKGPVCRGQMALNVINDHFWVVFADPNLNAVEHEADFLDRFREKISMPAEADSNALPTNWLAYADQERDYIEARNAFLKENAERAFPKDLSMIWQGDKNNDNLALTVFRHNDAATVVKGLVGDKPQTAWIITYPLFERIHYLLVAGYDVYGNIGHQLNSRMYMDFLRMEGESNFLSLLPKQARTQVWNHWYRGFVSPVEKFVQSANRYNGDTSIVYKTDTPLNELYAMVKEHTKKAANKEHSAARGFDSNDFLNAAQTLNKVRGIAANQLPQASFVRVFDKNNTSHFYSLTKNNAYTNISHIVAEKARRIPEEDTVTFAHGFLSSHPNAFFNVRLDEFERFVQDIAALSSETDLTVLFEKYGVRRSSERFWQFSDQLHEHYLQNEPVKFGYFDFNRLENL